MQKPPLGLAYRRNTFAVLSYPNHRLWFFGQMASLFGTWMQSTARDYLVFELTLCGGVIADGRILALILLAGAVGLFGMSFAALLPAWAVLVLGGDSRTNGFLQSARGNGALAAALGIASLAHRRFKGTVITALSFLYPVALLLFTFTRALPLSLFTLLAVGAANVTVINLANSLVQNLVPDAVRGRVMGMYALSFFGFMPIGAVLAGGAATAVGVPVTFAVPSIRRLG